MALQYILLIYSFVIDQIALLPNLATTNNISMYMLCMYMFILISFQDIAFTNLSMYLDMELLDHMVILFCFVETKSYCVELTLYPMLASNLG